jgi:hypothetical protein
MKVVGFSFIKDAVKMQYPIVEAIKSILPICDEVVVAVGASEDGTRELVANIDKKVRIIDTVWDFTLKENGKVLATETNKAFAAIASDADWCVYIQGDEVMHEEGHEEVLTAMEKWKDNKKVDGLLFKYRHFFGSYDFIGIEKAWYRNEIRVVKNNKAIYSYKDAQGFRKDHNKKLKVKTLSAFIHHYGWVQSPAIMMAKNLYKTKIYNNEFIDEKAVLQVPEGYTDLLVNALQEYTHTHPIVMKERIANVDFVFNYDVKKNKLSTKNKIKNWGEKYFGIRLFDYKNYIKI